MNKEISRMYEELLKIQEKYSIYELKAENEVYPNYCLYGSKKKIKWLEGSEILQIFDSYINDHSGYNLIFNSLAYLERNGLQNEVTNLIMTLLENDPRLYSNLQHGFYELKENHSYSPQLDKILQFKKVVDGIQVGIKEKEYKTPFYNVKQGKYDGPYFTFKFDDPAIKQKIETKLFPKLQQVLKEKYGDQVEAELKSNGQVWLKKFSDIDLNGEIQNMVNQISKSL